MNQIPIDGKHDPKTAIFWASFATESGQQQRHCHTVTLYQTSEGGFFIVQAPPPLRGYPTMAEPIEDPQEWLKKQIERLETEGVKKGKGS